jgi:hypothetical protein
LAFARPAFLTLVLPLQAHRKPEPVVHRRGVQLPLRNTRVSDSTTALDNVEHAGFCVDCRRNEHGADDNKRTAAHEQIS